MYEICANKILKENVCALKVVLCALIWQPVCARALLRGNIVYGYHWDSVILGIWCYPCCFAGKVYCRKTVQRSNDNSPWLSCGCVSRVLFSTSVKWFFTFLLWHHKGSSLNSISGKFWTSMETMTYSSLFNEDSWQCKKMTVSKRWHYISLWCHVTLHYSGSVSVTVSRISSLLCCPLL